VHPEDHDRPRIGVDTVDDEIRQAGFASSRVPGDRPGLPRDWKSSSCRTAPNIRRPTREAAAGLLAAIHATMPRKSSFAGLVQRIVTDEV
jgi:hypothetical protein